MSSNLDYLNPSLQPLEDKIASYLAAEKELQRAEVQVSNLPVQEADEKASADSFEQRPPTGSFEQHPDEVHNELLNLRDDLTLLRREIIAMLPVRDEWVKVNLGYGPSRVGAFRTADSSEAEPEYELRIVH
ncbi:hypothetical protein J0X19_01945 [Hymenobacter sp. BT186]|uniref:Uncharacterized protein n=1 Tax=Hymenobacter telluris TaxID=2816474 RepID=A0A939J954_9BACT|nr:hypothetical protein [Hymenobacter telluris]MBO0356696.1 hypothetical protein [Hymenobacter telluris]MBW3372721.1 hypothetical protein [Hymenobacter norwichensis]